MRTRPEARKPFHPRERNGSYYPGRPRRCLPTQRTVIDQDNVELWGWPSRGGLIVLEHATSVDFTFLGFDPVHPPPRRDPNQDAEDAVCQKLLLLGAKWFDSKARYYFYSAVVAHDAGALSEVDAGEEPKLTRMERRWVSVAVVGDRDGHVGKQGEEGEEKETGGIWVLDCDTNIRGVIEPKNMRPTDTGRIAMARNMEEKCEILKAMGARFFASPDQYEGGAACVAAWKNKTQGEVGPLVKTKYEEDEPSLDIPLAMPDLHFNIV